MRYVIKTPGGSVEYDVPIMKVQEYSLEDIFSKGLLLLIPFYIFSHEKNFQVYNNNEQKLTKLKAEYQDILERLFMNDFPLIQCYLGIILKQPNCHPTIRQTALTFQMIFLLFLSIYYEISIRYSFMVGCILLIHKMLIIQIMDRKRGVTNRISHIYK